MIDTIIGLFLQLDQAGILTIRQLLSNLLLVGVSRCIYLSTYYISYFKDDPKKIRNVMAEKPKYDLLLSILPQIAIIIGGMIFLLPAIFISLYSLCMSGIFIKNYATKVKSTDINMIGNLIIITSILISIYRFFLTKDHFSLSVIAICVLIFFLSQQMDLFGNLKQKFHESSNSTYRIGRAFYCGLLFLLIVISAIFTVGTVINAPAIQTVMVEMRDGTDLATDIYFAPNSLKGPRPVILIRTPYGKNSMSAFSMLYSTQGYHMVIQDLRGTGGSGDNETYVMFIRDSQDGVDTLDWILEQSWCNGKIATIGLSALAINTFAFAGMNPTGLVAQSLVVGTPDLYEFAMFPGGALREALVTKWIEETSPWNKDYQLNQLISHAKKDSFYNTTSLYMTPGPTFDQVNVPALHIGGWYDCFQQGTLNGYMGYDDLGGNGARGKQLLIMGPFTHGFPGEGRVGEVVFPTKTYSASSLYFDWETKLFDHILLNKDYDWSVDRVAYYMMGDLKDNSPNINDYRFASDWPIPGYSNVSWYLTDDGSLQVGTADLNNRNYSYNFDPRDPVPTVGGTNLMIANGPYDQRSIEDREDVLIFESESLAEKVDVVGRMWANLWVISNCTNTDFTVKITDVYPDGRSMLVTDGIINAIRRDGFDRDAPLLNSSGPTQVTIDLWSTAYQFNVGHKIRIAISSSNYPRFAINPNSGAPQEIYSYQYLNRYIANNTILIWPDFPSYIILPSPPS